VDDILKIDYRKIPKEEYRKCESNHEGIFAGIFGDPLKTPETEEIDLKLLYKLIYQANLKIDYIMEMLESKDTDRYDSAGTKYVNISGSGIKFISNQLFSVGDIIALRIFLPLASSTWMTVLGEVKSSVGTSQKSEYLTAVRFMGLSEDDRESIIRYVFKKQREILRETSDTKEWE
jgi:hypothetical protein